VTLSLARMRLSLWVDPTVVAAVVSEQLGSTASALERDEDLHDLGIDDRLDAPLPGLGGKVGDDLLVVDADVLAQHRGQPIGLVALGVVLRADAKEPEVAPTRSVTVACSRGFCASTTERTAVDEPGRRRDRR
jgi:hypothetical protein